MLRPINIILDTREITGREAFALLEQFDVRLDLEALADELRAYGCEVHAAITIRTEYGYLEESEHEDSTPSA